MLKGLKRDADFACLLNGKKPAKEFIESRTQEEQIKLSLILQELLTGGYVSNKQRFRKLEGPIWEFKSDKNRVLCFLDGRCWILTNGFRKESRKTKRKYIDLARRIMEEHKSRT